MRRSRPRWPSGPWLGDSSLLLKLLAAFLLVLTLASAITLVIETRLTRTELREQAEEELEEDFDAVTREHAEIRETLRVSAEQARRAVAATRFVGRALAVVTTDPAIDLATLVEDGVARAGNDPTLPAPSSEAVARARQRDPVFAIVPVDGRYAEVLVVTLDATRTLLVGRWLDQAWTIERYPQTDATLVVLVDDEVVARSRPVDVPVPSLADGPVGGDLYEQGPSLATYGRLAEPVGGWGVEATYGLVVSEPLAALDRSLAFNRGLMIALLIGATGLLAWGTTRVLTRPLLALTRTARRIAAGDLDARFEVDTQDEIGVLAGALERMRAALRAQLAVIGRQSAELQAAARRIVGAQDDERRRLAGDLHDGIQQQLVMLRMRAGFVRSHVAQDPAGADGAVAELAEDIDRILDRLRETSQAVFPSILQDRGLNGGLHSLAGRAAIEVEVVTVPDPLPRLAREVESNAYFLAAEAVTNVVKHARATRIEVSATVAGGELVLTVRDDGCGFDVASAEARGLEHLRDRARAVGGSLGVRSAPGRGTVVTAVLPTSVPGPLEEEQDRGHTAVEVELLGEPELAEDGVGVLLDGALADDELAGDGRVALPGGHGREDLELPRGQPRQP